MNKKRNSSENKHDDEKVEKLVKTSLIKQLQRHSFYKFFQRKDVKRYLIVATSAMVIGLMFGFITLKVLNHVGQPKDVGALTVNTNDTSDEKAEENSSQEIKQLDAYVLQGGVFSSKENLNKWKNRFEQEGLRVIAWERDELYHLFLGIGSSEQALNKLKERLTAKDLDVYVKEWQTNKHDMQLTKNDYTWLNSFITLWEDSISNVDNEQLFSEEWPDLIKNSADLSEKITTFKNDLQTKLGENSLDRTEDKHYMLLLFWSLFDQSILD